MSEENLLLNVNYRVTDGDGDTIDGQLSIDVDDDTPTVVADDICEDIPTEPGDVANFVLVLDTSGSVDDQFALIQDAVENLLNQLGSSGAQDVRVHIVEFGTTANVVGTYDIIVNGAPVQSALNDAIADVNALGSGGSTNYEAGLQQALQFIQGTPSQTINVTDVVSSFDANSNSVNSSTNDIARIVGNGSTQIALVSGWMSPGTANGQMHDVEGSISGGWGVDAVGDNESVENPELLRFDFGSFNNFGVSNFTSDGFSGVDVLSATFTLDDNNFGGDTTFNYTIHFVGGGTQIGSTTLSGAANVTLTGTGGNAGSLFDYIEFSVSGIGANGDIDLQSVVTAPVAPGTLPNADVNSLIFISDGEPNTANNDSGAAISVGAQTAINHILGIADGSNEVGNTETDGDGAGLDQAFTIEAFHVGSPTTTLDDRRCLIDDNDANSQWRHRQRATTACILIGNGRRRSRWCPAGLSPGTANSQLVDANGGNGDGIGCRRPCATTDELDDAGTAAVRLRARSTTSTGPYQLLDVGRLQRRRRARRATFTLDDNDFGGDTTLQLHVSTSSARRDPDFGSINFDGSGNVTLTGTGANAGSFIDYIEFSVTGASAQRRHRPAVGRHAVRGAGAAQPGRRYRRRRRQHHCARRSGEQPERADRLAGRHAGQRGRLRSDRRA